MNTYDRCKELRGRAACGHEGGARYVLAEMETLQDTNENVGIWAGSSSWSLESSPDSELTV